MLTAPGLDVVGPFPPGVQRELVFAAALAAKPAESEVAQAFLRFLTSPGAAAVIKAKGMTPG